MSLFSSPVYLEPREYDISQWFYTLAVQLKQDQIKPSLDVYRQQSYHSFTFEEFLYTILFLGIAESEHIDGCDVIWHKSIRKHLFIDQLTYVPLFSPLEWKELFYCLKMMENNPIGQYNIQAIKDELHTFNTVYSKALISAIVYYLLKHRFIYITRSRKLIVSEYRFIPFVYPSYKTMNVKSTMKQKHRKWICTCWVESCHDDNLNVYKRRFISSKLDKRIKLGKSKMYAVTSHRNKSKCENTTFMLIYTNRYIIEHEACVREIKNYHL